MVFGKIYQQLRDFSHFSSMQNCRCIHEIFFFLPWIWEMGNCSIFKESLKRKLRKVPPLGSLFRLVYDRTERFGRTFGRFWPNRLGRTFGQLNGRFGSANLTKKWVFFTQNHSICFRKCIVKYYLVILRIDSTSFLYQFWQKRGLFLVHIWSIFGRGSAETRFWLIGRSLLKSWFHEFLSESEFLVFPHCVLFYLSK